jgi:hypothetical protein
MDSTSNAFETRTGERRQRERRNADLPYAGNDRRRDERRLGDERRA